MKARMASAGLVEVSRKSSSSRYLTLTWICPLWTATFYPGQRQRYRSRTRAGGD
ncbi:hypothetical protein KCP71_03510 [Salmonella enterica subsp. enterica]|nr:hypothetical protein KCP71_03510 [Salmonella enterica subsp. enterica]